MRATPVVLLAVLAASSAYAFTFPAGESVGSIDFPTSWLSDIDREGKSGAMVIKYKVPPGKDEAFVNAWMELKNQTWEKEEGILAISLTKTATDNIMFASYAEFEGHDAFMKHIKSEYVKDYFKHIAAMDVLMDAYPTLHIVRESGKGKKDACMPSARNSWAKDEVFHLAVKYIVPPSHCKEFDSIIRDVSKQVGDKETGNRIYAWSKTLTDNYVYMLYGEWDDLTKYQEHWESKHLGQLLDFNRKHMIAWSSEPLIQLAHECRSHSDA